MDDHGRPELSPDQAERAHEAAPRRAPWTPPTLRRIAVKRTSESVGSFFDGLSPTTK